jgi:hypothetical protein
MMGRKAKIKLKYDLPMALEHGMFKDVELVGTHELLSKGFWVTTPGSGEDALVFMRECTVLEWIDAEGAEEKATD